MLQPGEQVGSYVVESHLGSGGMAEVYAVRHAVLGTAHALKVLRPELAAHADVRARFLSEGRIQAHTRHPHVVAVTDVVAQEGVAGLVMELLSGGSLADRVGAPVPPATVVDVLGKVLDGLQVLHERGVVHRDLKPGNVLFRDASWAHPVLVDLGVARVADAEAAHRTRTGMLIGTPAYMSPEQVLGKPVDPRSDVFSLGVVAYELLTGRLPFEGDGDFSTMQAVVRGERPPLARAAPAAAGPLAEAVEVALAAEPGARFRDASSFAAALRAATARPPARNVAAADVAPASAPAIERPPAPAAAPAPRGGGCWRLMAAMGCASVLGLLGLIGAVLWAANEVERADGVGRSVAAGLRHYKTDPQRNADDGFLADLVARADARVDWMTQPDGVAAWALAHAFDDGWQRQGTTWDPAAWAAARARADRVAQGPLTAMGVAADTIVTAGRCRRDAAGGEGACDALPARVQTFDALAGPDDGWLRAEVLWSVVGAVRARLERGDAVPPATLDALSGWCKAGVDVVDAAPVNGVYLLQVCLGALGATQRYGDWLDVADVYVARAQADGSFGPPTRTFLARSVAPACNGLPVDRWGRATSIKTPGTGGWADLCGFLALHGEGCGLSARRPQRCGIVRDGLSWDVRCEPLEEPGVPWGAALFATLRFSKTAAVCRDAP